jgi:hypothetical protein
MNFPNKKSPIGNHATPSLHTSKLGRIWLTLALASLTTLCLAGRAAADDVKIEWQETGVIVGTGYLPRVASDGALYGNLNVANAASIYQDATGFATFDYQTGFNRAQGTVDWNSPLTIYGEVGHEASIAVKAGCVDELTCPFGSPATPPLDFAIEVHQGGQDNGSELWYRIGQGNYYDVRNSSSELVWASSAYPYDHGFNPTVAIDGTPLGPQNPQPLTLIEVHQAGVGLSTLWYHYGAYNVGTTSSSVTWGPAVNSGFQGYAPTVSVALGLAVLVAQGSAGTLWYSLGVVNSTDGTIAWTTPTTYTNGYNPTISIELDGGWNAIWDLVEAHQADTGAGELLYRTGAMNYGSGSSYPTAITWTSPDTDYATGCYPSVGILLFHIFGDEVYAPPSVAETHSADCGEASEITSSLGFFEFD